MDTTLLVETASRHGVLGTAMVDALARGESYFAAKEPSAENLTAWITALKQEAGHLFAPTPPGPGDPASAQPPAWMTNPAERLTWARTHQPQAPVQRRPGRYDPTPEQLKTLEGKTPAERLTAYREWQAAAQRPGA